jgi:hypothetical protein
MRAKLKELTAVALALVVSAGAAFISLSATDAAGLLTPAAVEPDNASPDPFSAADRRSIENLVRTELRALVAQDAKRAFSKLTPSTQGVFGEPEKFLEAVARELPPIFVTKKFSLIGIDRSARPISQQVLITDILGQEWLANFEVERQDNGDWRVKGCVVEAAPGERA